MEWRYIITLIFRKQVMLLKISLTYFIEILASVTVILPIIVGSITIKSFSNISYRIILIYCFIYALFEAIGWYFVLHHWQNHFLQNTMSYLDISFLGIYFYTVLDLTLMKKIVLLLISTTILFTLWSHWGSGQDFNRMDSFALSVGSLSLIAMSLLFFYQLLNNLEIENILKYPHFWINVGILIYFSGAFFTFIFAEYITFSQDKSVSAYISINAFLLFFQHIFLAIGLWFSKTPPQLSPSSK
jgi:hypothetical protein